MLIIGRVRTNGMLKSHISWPGARRPRQTWSLLRLSWTTPTNLLGHLLGRALCGSPHIRIEAPAASAWLYVLPPGRWQALGVTALTIGHVIIAQADRLVGTKGRLVLAHELAHTRQHDWLGPLYLPAHALCEVASVLITVIRGRPVFSAVHAYNPLEQTLICISAGACNLIADGEMQAPFPIEAFLGQFGALVEL